MIITEMTNSILDDPELVAHFRADSSMGLLGDVTDAAYCAPDPAAGASRFVIGRGFVKQLKHT